MANHDADIKSIISTLASLTFTIFPSPSDYLLKRNRGKAGAFGVWASEFFDLIIQHSTQSTLESNINSLISISSNHVGSSAYNTSNPAGKYCYWINVLPKGNIGYDYNMYTAKLELEARYLL